MSKGFIVIVQHVVGNSQEGFTVAYEWATEFFDSRDAAIKSGWRQIGSDDFNIGVVSEGRLVSFDWMDKPIAVSPEQLRKVEEQIGLCDEEEV